MGQERLGPSYFFISLVSGPLNSLVWYVPSFRYTHDLGWRIHYGVKVTESSTNKQHIIILCPSPSCFSRTPNPLRHVYDSVCLIIWAIGRGPRDVYEEARHGQGQCWGETGASPRSFSLGLQIPARRSTLIPSTRPGSNVLFYSVVQ